MVVFADFFHNFYQLKGRFTKGYVSLSISPSIHQSPIFFNLTQQFIEFLRGRYQRCSCSLMQPNRVEPKEIDISQICSSPRKSLVKGERFVRYEEKLEVILHTTSKMPQIESNSVKSGHSQFQSCTYFFQTKKQDSFGHFLIVVAVSLLKFSMKKKIKWRKVCVLEISTINYSGNYNMQMRLFHKRNQYFILEI